MATPHRDLLEDASDGDYEQDIDSGDIPGAGDSAPGEHTPNGTPLPRGPPPPHTVLRDRPLSLAEGGRSGHPMGGAATLTSVRIELRHLTDATADHPNVLLFNDSNNEDDSGEEHVDPGHDGTGERDGPAATIISTMAAEGRELMTPAEVLQVTMPMPTNAEIAADLGAWGPHPAPTSTSTSSGTGHHATAVALHTPPNFTTSSTDLNWLHT